MPVIIQLGVVQLSVRRLSFCSPRELLLLNTSLWDILGIVGTLAVVGALGWVLIHVIKQAQAGDRSCSDKDSGWYNGAG
jgi:hypothetical protein